VDASKSGEIKSDLAERQATTDALLARLREQIEALEARLPSRGSSVKMARFFARGGSE
jgi:site-specific recombinase